MRVYDFGGQRQKVAPALGQGLDSKTLDRQTSSIPKPNLSVYFFGVGGIGTKLKHLQFFWQVREGTLGPYCFENRHLPKVHGDACAACVYDDTCRGHHKFLSEEAPSPKTLLWLASAMLCPTYKNQRI